MAVFLTDKIMPLNGGFTGMVDSDQVIVDASVFTGNLSVTDTDLQTALETIDALTLGGAWADLTGTPTALLLDQETTPQTVLGTILLDDTAVGAQTAYYSVAEGDGTNHALIRGSVYETGVYQAGTLYQSLDFKVDGVSFLTLSESNPGVAYAHGYLPFLATDGFIKTNGGTGLLSVDTSTYLTTESDPLAIHIDGSSTTTDVIPFAKGLSAVQTRTSPATFANIDSAITLIPDSYAPSQQLAGMKSMVTVDATSTEAISSVYGLQFLAYNQGSGAIANLFGLYGEAYNAGGTVSQLIGMYGIGISSGANTPLMVGINAGLSIGSASTVTDAYGMFIDATSISGGSTVDNLYGLYIDDQAGAGTLNYSLYTKAGAIRFGDLAGSGAGIVAVDNDGLLSWSAGGGASAFTDLTDVPTAYTSQANKLVAVKTDETGLEFIAPPSSMIYPGAGIALSTGSAWDTSITNNSANWNTAYGWGNHASAGYLPLAGGTMTGQIDLRAGSATADTAPLRFYSGALNTVPETGAAEFLTDDYYVTNTVKSATLNTFDYSTTTVLSTSVYNTGSYYAYAFRCFDPLTPLIGTTTYSSWLPTYLTATNQRINVDLGSAKVVDKIQYSNYHYFGTGVTNGVQNFTFWGSNTAGAFSNTTYATDTDWVQITTSQSTFNQHTAADIPELNSIDATNTTAYRYYSFKFADTWGGGWMGMRALRLLTKGDPERNRVVQADNQFNYGSIPFTSNNGRLTNSTALKFDKSALSIIGDGTQLYLGAGWGGRLHLGSSDTTVAAGEYFGSIEFEASDATGDGTGLTAFIRSIAIGAGTNAALIFGSRIVGQGDALEGMRLNENNSLGIGVTSPTAKLHLKAGTATASTAPLKFTSGTLLTGAEAGAVEFLTDKFYATITTGAARKELTLNDAALTSGRIPIATTNGRLTDDADLTFDTDTLSATKVAMSSLTSGRVPYAIADGLLVDNANLAYNSGTGALTVAAGAAQNLMGTGLHINTAAGSTAVYDTQIEGDTDANLVYVDASADKVGFGTNAPTAKVDINSDFFRLRTAKTPASAAATGTAGDICWDDSYIYVCTATDTWKRSAIATW